MIDSLSQNGPMIIRHKKFQIQKILM